MSMRQTIIEAYEKALTLAREGEDIVIYIEVRGSMRDEPIVLLSTEKQTGRKTEG